jgi:hypothetical protein
MAIEYELYNLLPVPEADVPLNEILEFKAKRYDELIGMRVYLDELYQSIISSSDIPRAKNTQLDKLETALQAVDQTLSESGIRKTLTSLRGFIAGEFVNIAGIGSSAMGAAPFIGMAPLTAGVAGAGITFAVRSVLSPKIVKEPHPLTYVESIKKGGRARAALRASSGLCHAPGASARSGGGLSHGEHRGSRVAPPWRQFCLWGCPACGFLALTA